MFLLPMIPHWPTNWSHKWTEASYNPSVTLGTSPTIELDKTDTGTSAASVAGMFWYAQYNEASGADTLMGQACL